MTTLFAGGWDDPASDRDAPGSGRHRHRRGRRPRLRRVLLDPPSVTGLPPWQLSESALPRTRGRGLIAMVAVVALALSALAGIAVALRSSRAPAPFPHFTLTAPFPSVTASGEPTHSMMSGQNEMTHPSKMPTMTTPPAPSPTMTTASAPPSATPTPTPTVTATPTTATQPTVTATYAVVSQWSNGFVGEVSVSSTEYAAISGWQIVVGLPYDQFTAVSANASGYASNHILVLQPASYADSVPAGGTLNVFFTVYGTQTTPDLCGFNNITCQ